MMPLLDRHRRPLRNLRLSVTDRCNLRCAYCMPEEEYSWLPKGDILTFDEISRLVDVFLSLGVDKVRFTGGEPLLRRELPHLLAMIAAKPGVRDVALTTNGVLLAQHAAELRKSGLRRITVSLDTLDAARFTKLTRRSELTAVLDGIDAARDQAFESLKLDTVVLRGVNDDEIVALLEFARTRDAEIRFIEYMDVGGATRWSADQVVSQREILERIESAHGAITPLAPSDAIEAAAPAQRFRLESGQSFGIIASTTQPFCGACDRSRLTADGTWYLCLYARLGVDLRRWVRSGARTQEIAEVIERAWTSREDRGAEQQLALGAGRGSVFRAERRDDPRLEMHTRGG